MPEGPSIVILKEEVQGFIGKKIIGVTGTSKLDTGRLNGQTIIDFKSWGKHFLICFKTFTVRVHLMLFGSYSINESKERKPLLGLIFKKGNINFYTCSLKIIEEDLDKVYDWSADVMHPEWDAEKAKVKLKTGPGRMVCDVLLDQHIFSGVGNIIKNEVLFRVKVHPESNVIKLPSSKLNELIRQVVRYSFEFLQWKKEGVLKQHWLAYSKKTCIRDHVPLIKKDTGKTRRRSFYCTNCQALHA